MGRAFLSKLDIEQIRGELAEGYSIAEIAKRFGVTSATIRWHVRDLIIPREYRKRTLGIEQP